MHCVSRTGSTHALQYVLQCVFQLQCVTVCAAYETYYTSNVCHEIYEIYQTYVFRSQHVTFNVILSECPSIMHFVTFRWWSS
mmetsp:Transcript_33846/g.54614  ORF Transcript_33846/g.54614 Transcript_33846/m.54614 type:complete len:82 (-) Transcript_33846:368-613(-)